MVGRFVHLDFREQISRGSKYPTHPRRIRGAIIGQKLYVCEGYVKGLDTRKGIF